MLRNIEKLLIDVALDLGSAKNIMGLAQFSWSKQLILQKLQAINPWSLEFFLITYQRKDYIRRWDFAQDYCGRLWLKIGLILLIPTAIVQIPFVHSSDERLLIIMATKDNSLCSFCLNSSMKT